MIWTQEAWPYSQRKSVFLFLLTFGRGCYPKVEHAKQTLKQSLCLWDQGPTGRGPLETLWELCDQLVRLGLGYTAEKWATTFWFTVSVFPASLLMVGLTAFELKNPVHIHGCGQVEVPCLFSFWLGMRMGRLGRGRWYCPLFTYDVGQVQHSSKKGIFLE